MKKIFLLLAAILPLVASADALEIDGIWYNLVKKNKSAEVTKNPTGNYNGNIVIPNTVNYDGVTYTVKSIAATTAMWPTSQLSSLLWQARAGERTE